MPIIYVLKLQGGKYYIGKSQNHKNRIDEHFNGRGSEWTKLHKPEELIDTIVQNMNFTELGVTLQYMKENGIDNVRGASYCTIILTNSQKTEIERHIRGEYDLCLMCGDSGHFIKDCPRNRSMCEKLRGWFCFCKKTPILDYSLIDEDSTVIHFGKYSGCTYNEVLLQDKGYCNWVKNTNSSLSEFNKFKKWLNNH
jgi:hypothetical protein